MLFFAGLLRARGAKGLRAQGDGEQQGNSEPCLDVLAVHLKGFWEDSGVEASDLEQFLLLGWAQAQIGSQTKQTGGSHRSELGFFHISCVIGRWQWHILGLVCIWNLGTDVELLGLDNPGSPAPGLWEMRRIWSLKLPLPLPLGIWSL